MVTRWVRRNWWDGSGQSQTVGLTLLPHHHTSPRLKYSFYHVSKYCEDITKSFYHKMFPQRRIRTWPRCPLWKFLWQGNPERTFFHIWKNVLWHHVLYWEWEEDTCPAMCQKSLRYRNPSRGCCKARSTIENFIWFKKSPDILTVTRFFIMVIGSKWDCLLWIDKTRSKDKTYIWVSVWWKTTN